MCTRWYLIIISFFTCFIGIGYACLRNQWLFIEWNTPFSIQKSAPADVAEKKEITLYLWKNHNWYQEKSTVLMSETAQNQIQTIANQWLMLAYQERHILAKVTLEHVLINPSSKETYLSFDKNPFDATLPAHAVYRLIVALLKTMQENGIKIQSVVFLVQHQALIHEQWDFSKPWMMNEF